MLAGARANALHASSVGRASTVDARLVPLTSSIHGCFHQRGRLLSGRVIEDQPEYSKCAEILHKLKPKPAQEEESKMGFPFINQADYGAVGEK